MSTIERIDIEGYDVDVKRDRNGRVESATILETPGGRPIRTYRGPSAVTNAKKWTLR